MLICDEYLTPTTLADAFAAMERHRGRSRIVAGCTDMLPWAREGRAGDVDVPVLIDVSKIPELNERRVDNTRVRLGAATPIQSFIDDAGLARALPCMPHCAVWFGGQTSGSKYALMWQWSGGGGYLNGYGDFDQIDISRMG